MAAFVFSSSASSFPPPPPPPPPPLPFSSFVVVVAFPLLLLLLFPLSSSRSLFSFFSFNVFASSFQSSISFLHLSFSLSNASVRFRKLFFSSSSFAFIDKDARSISSRFLRASLSSFNKFSRSDIISSIRFSCAFESFSSKFFCSCMFLFLMLLLSSFARSLNSRSVAISSMSSSLISNCASRSIISVFLLLSFVVLLSLRVLSSSVSVSVV